MNVNYAQPTANGRQHLNLNVNTMERVLSALAGGLLIYSAFRGSAPLTKGAIASFLLYRAVTGNCPAYSALGKQTTSHPQNINIRTAITVNKPRVEVYAFWRQLENLPLFMKHLESVVQDDDKYSRWSAKIPGFPGSVNWKAEIVKEHEGSLLSWASLPDADIVNAGKIEFRDARENGTEIHAVITYSAPLGKAGEAVARLLNPLFENMVKEDMRNFRRYIETGEIPTIEGQPYGSKHKKGILSAVMS